MTATSDTTRLAVEYVTLAATIEQATTRQKEIKAILADLGPGKHTAGDYTVQVTQPRRFDKTRAAKAFPVEQHPEYYSLAFDQKRFEHANAPTVVDQYRTDGTPTVTVK